MINKKAFTTIELLFVAAIFAVMSVILMPIAKAVKDRASRITCAANLRKISLGLHTFAADHDGKFPADLVQLYPKYVESENVFVCPSTKNSRGNSYVYTSGLSEISDLRTVIIQDAEGNHRRQGKNILRIDGSVEWVK